jgi:hypothetical protein
VRQVVDEGVTDREPELAEHSHVQVGQEGLLQVDLLVRWGQMLPRRVFLLGEVVHRDHVQVVA